MLALNTKDKKSLHESLQNFIQARRLLDCGLPLQLPILLPCLRVVPGRVCFAGFRFVGLRAGAAVLCPRLTRPL